MKVELHLSNTSSSNRIPILLAGMSQTPVAVWLCNIPYRHCRMWHLTACEMTVLYVQVTVRRDKFL